MKRTLAQPPLPSLVAPVASVIRFAKLRPFTGRLSTSSGDTFTPMRAEEMSMTFDSADTVTASCSDATPIVTSTVSTCPTPSTASRAWLAKPDSSNATAYAPGLRLVTVYVPSPPVMAVRTLPVLFDVTVTVTPGIAALLSSRTRPVMRDSVCCAITAVGSATAASAMTAATNLNKRFMESLPR